MYLENIFIGSEDIRKQLPKESVLFDQVHTTFMVQMQQLNSVRNVVQVCAVGQQPWVSPEHCDNY